MAAKGNERDRGEREEAERERERENPPNAEGVRATGWTGEKSATDGGGNAQKQAATSGFR